MKKIILLIITSLIFLTGCYDNVELNKLSIISGIGIDYVDDEFVLTYEIYNDNKSENTGELISDTITGKGKTISEAFNNANMKTSKKDFFAHLKLVIVSENLINGHFKEINDYLIRDTDIREEFFLVVASNTTPEEILKSTSVKHPVASEYIVKLLSNEKYNNSLPTKEIYQKILSKLIGSKTDIVLNSVSIIDNHLSLSNSYMFKEYNMLKSLSEHDSSLYTLLMFNNEGISYQKEYDGYVFVINICEVKTNIDVESSNILVNLELEARILENNPNLNLKDTDTYNMLNNDFESIIKDDIYNFVKMVQSSKSDILGLQELYYKSNNKDNKKLWETADIDVNVNLKINYKGFIFEVENEE